jgi:hypothetical protein
MTTIPNAGDPSIQDALDEHRRSLPPKRKLDGNFAQTALVWVMTALHPESLEEGQMRLSTVRARELMAGTPCRGFAYRADDDGPEYLKRMVRRAIIQSRGNSSERSAVTSANNYNSALKKFILWAQDQGYGVCNKPDNVPVEPETDPDEWIILERKSRPGRCPTLAALKAAGYSYRPWSEKDRAQLERLAALADAHLKTTSELRQRAEELRASLPLLADHERLPIAQELGRLTRPIRTSEQKAATYAKRAAAKRAHLTEARWTDEQMAECERIERCGLVDLARGKRKGKQKGEGRRKKGVGAVSQSTMNATMGGMGRYYGYLVHIPDDYTGTPRLPRAFSGAELQTACQTEAWLKSYVDWMGERHARVRGDKNVDQVPTTVALTLDRIGWVVSRFWIPSMRESVGKYVEFLRNNGLQANSCSMEELRLSLARQDLLNAFSESLNAKRETRGDADFTLELIRRASLLETKDFELQIWGHHEPNDASRWDVDRMAVAAYRVIDNYLPWDEDDEGKEFIPDPDMPTIAEMICDVAIPLWKGAKKRLSEAAIPGSTYGGATVLTTAASMARDAIVLLLMMYLPLRQKNWRQTMLGVHLRRTEDSSGNTTGYSMHYRTKEVKNGRQITASLPQHIWRYLDEYLGYGEFRGRGIRDILVQAKPTGYSLEAKDMERDDSFKSSIAFPAVGGKEISSDTLANNLADWVASSPNPTVARFKFHPHSCRHITASTHLDACKGGSWSNLAMVSELLADDPGTVARFYAALNSTSAVTEGSIRVQGMVSELQAMRKPASSGDGVPEAVRNAYLRMPLEMLRGYAIMTDEQLSAVTGKDGAELAMLGTLINAEIARREQSSGDSGSIPPANARVPRGQAAA